MALPTARSFLGFLKSIFTGYVRGDGNFLISAGKALQRLGQRMLRIDQPGPGGFQPKAPTVKPYQPPSPHKGVPPKPFAPSRPQAYAGPTARRPTSMPATPGGIAAEYTDGIDVGVQSSWIAGVNFRPLGGRAQIVSQPLGSRLGSNVGMRDYLFQKGDLTMVTQGASKNNSEGRYTYPNVPRKVMNDMLFAPSKGRFYWWGYGGSKALRSYSNRAKIGKRMRARGRYLQRNPNSPHRISRSRAKRSH